jgi:pimeloyl-ACP methyl ester carboxylesterase
VNGFEPPIERMRRITVPTLAIHGTKTFPVLVDSTTLCAQTIPGAGHAVLPGQSHEVKAEAIAPELVRFFSGSEARAAA